MVIGALLSVVSAVILLSAAVLGGGLTAIVLSLVADAVAFACIGLALQRRTRGRPPREPLSSRVPGMRIPTGPTSPPEPTGWPPARTGSADSR